MTTASKKTTPPAPPPAPAPVLPLAAAASALDPVRAAAVEAIRGRLLEELAAKWAEHSVRDYVEGRVNAAAGVAAYVAVRLQLLQQLADPHYLAQLATARGLVVPTAEEVGFIEAKQAERAAKQADLEAERREVAELQEQFQADRDLKLPDAGLAFADWRKARQARVEAGLPVDAERRAEAEEAEKQRILDEAARTARHAAMYAPQRPPTAEERHAAELAALREQLAQAQQRGAA